MLKPLSVLLTLLTALQPTDRYLKTGAKRPVGGPDECIDSIAASAWINTEVVMNALHVQPAPSGNWSVCGNVIEYTSTYKDLPATVYPSLIPVWLHNLFDLA